MEKVALWRKFYTGFYDESGNYIQKPLEAAAQEVGIGQWRDHLPYRQAFYTAEGDEFVWAATAHSIFSYNKLDNSVTRMSKVWGMSDVGVSTMRYHESSKTLIVGYTNGNLDLLENEHILM